MKTIRLGKSNLMVSAVGFGGIPIQRLSDDDAVALVRGCLDLGINYIDTAHGYTTSEERVGRALKGRRDGIVLATKSHGLDRDTLTQELEQSLSRLGVDYIDLFQLHNVASQEEWDKVLAPGGALEAARDALQAGKIGHIGVTSHALAFAQKAVRSGLFETIMFPLNFVAREPGEELYPEAVANDVGFIAMKPLGGGMLSDARLAFQYLRQFPHAVPIPGIERIEEMREIIAVMAEPAGLTADDRQRIEGIREELGTRFCRRCDYCQPCRQGIPISSLMTAPSLIKRMPPQRALAMMERSVAKAVECEKCGECGETCPYHLPIREMLDEAIALYGRLKAAV